MSHCTRFALAAVIVLCSVSVGHSIPQLVNYQGILTDAGGTPITLAKMVEFRIWDMSAGGTELWMESQSVTPDGDGLFNVLLGSANPIPDSALAAADAYLGMTISPDAEMSPRTQLVSVAYAYRPGTVDGASGGTISGDVAIQSDLDVDGDLRATGKATIGSGHTNTGASAFVTGNGNTASGDFSTVGGGSDNTADGNYCTVGGGRDNTSTGTFGGKATVAGGRNNVASREGSTVGGGEQNVASGLRSTVPGGQLCEASGDFSFASGLRARAVHQGSFVWADASGANSISSTVANQFSARAAGGYRLFTNHALTTGVTLAAGGGAWAMVSDRNVKDNIRPVDGAQLLEKIAQLEISRWNYETQDPSIEHIGPMAQDFYRLFGVGDNNTTITTIDPDGIALAAIQELHKRNDLLTEQNQQLKSDMAELRDMVESLMADK